MSNTPPHPSDLRDIQRSRNDATHARAVMLLEAYQKRRPILCHSSIGSTWSGQMQQSYQNWRSAWMSECLRHMHDPDFTRDSILTAYLGDGYRGRTS